VTTAAVAIVPAHDEEAIVAITVKSLVGRPEVAAVVVVADGCRDRTAERAAGAGGRVLVSPDRLGKGGAVEFAMDRTDRAELYVLVDADVGETAAEAARLVREVASGSLDLAIGRLPAQDGGGFGFVKRIAGEAIRLLTGFEADAPLSGQRAVTGEALHACRPLARGFGLETAMTIDAVRLGFRVGEVDVAMTHRATGRSVAGFAHRGRQGLDILRAAVPRALRLR
jgi:glycosyltransferase involved in cell wall biosynthesis